MDPLATRDRLMVVGQRLFARHGVYQVSLRALHEEAGQRNASALHYHFGSREGLLDAILTRHNRTIEDERARVLDRLVAQGRADDVRSLVAAVVEPMSRKLADADGREFLRIVAQLGDDFDGWDDRTSTRNPPQSSRALDLLSAALLEVPVGLRHDRIAVFLTILTHTMSVRAARIDAGDEGLMPDEVFVDNLIAMSVGALTTL
jgi:AcrR family transcriptional regulator